MPTTPVTRQLAFNAMSPEQGRGDIGWLVDEWLCSATRPILVAHASRSCTSLQTCIVRRAGIAETGARTHPDIATGLAHRS
eukprot:4588223-Pleurochrysis_carterae.AAC.5